MQPCRNPTLQQTHHWKPATTAFEALSEKAGFMPLLTQDLVLKMLCSGRLFSIELILSFNRATYKRRVSNNLHLVATACNPKQARSCKLARERRLATCSVPKAAPKSYPLFDFTTRNRLRNQPRDSTGIGSSTSQPATHPATNSLSETCNQTF